MTIVHDASAEATPPDQTTEALARIDGCPKVCGNTEAPYRVEMETATTWTGYYRCSDCGALWRTGPQVARQEVQWFDGREAAKAAERSAIHHEDPVYNLVRPRMECC